MRLPARQQAPRRHDRHTTTVTIGGEHFRLTASQGTGGALGNVAMLGQSQRRRAPQGLRFRASSLFTSAEKIPDGMRVRRLRSAAVRTWLHYTPPNQVLAFSPHRPAFFIVDPDPMIRIPATVPALWRSPGHPKAECSHRNSGYEMIAARSRSGAH